tara:strand:+ start:1772 stop:2758 length:987 start_codon:yes stop_codon:yes gene_type:complete
MGMTNLQTVEVKLNSGEFTEFVFALATIAKQTNSLIEEVYEDIDIVSGKVVGTHKGVKFFGDGKQVPPYEEFGHYVANNTTKTVQLWVDKTKKFVDSYEFPKFDTVTCEGGSSEKVDVGLYSSNKLVEGFSLKWDHDAAERSQSPNWSSVVKLYGKFVDISDMKQYYQEQFDKFTIPGLRYSRAKGDWSQELLERAEVMRETVHTLEKNVAEKFVNKNFDSNKLAKSIIECYTGGQESIVFVELNSGSSYKVSNGIIAKLAEVLASGEYTFEQVKKDRTRDTYIRINGNNLMWFRTTASADKAPGQSNSDIRRIKRQTYLTLNLPAVK